MYHNKKINYNNCREKCWRNVGATPKIAHFLKNGKKKNPQKRSVFKGLLGAAKQIRTADLILTKTVRRLLSSICSCYFVLIAKNYSRL